jgi:hypothetical protein
MSVEMLSSNGARSEEIKVRKSAQVNRVQPSRKKSSPDKALSVQWVRPPQREHDK